MFFLEAGRQSLYHTNKQPQKKKTWCRAKECACVSIQHVMYASSHAGLRVYECLNVHQHASVACVCVRVCLSGMAVCGMSQFNQRSCQWFVFTACDCTPAVIWEESEERASTPSGAASQTHRAGARTRYSTSISLYRLGWFKGNNRKWPVPCK